MNYLRRVSPRRSVLRSLYALTGAVCLACGAAGGASANVDVFPMPGGRVASPQTQITFRGISPGGLGSVTAIGSRSGQHTGKLVADSDGNGASFIPTKPFTAGERVTVTAGVALAGGTSDSYQFVVAQPARTLGVSPGTYLKRTHGDVSYFQSRSDLQPAAVRLLKRSSTASSEYIFTGNQDGPLQNGPMIFDAAGNLTWFKPLPRNNFATDLRVQTLNGQPVLTWWQGGMTVGVGDGVDVIDNGSYRQLYTVRAGNGLNTDLHEFQLTPQGTALVTAYYPVYWDLRSVHGSSHAVVLDSVVQEIDLKTGLVLFQWDSLDHVPLSDSYAPYSSKSPVPYDPFHINSIQPSPDGNILISGRNTWAGYDLDPHTGAINWILGGKRSTFALASNAQFAWQHDIRMRSSSQVTVFDDGAGDAPTHKQSRALSLTLDFSHRTATRSFEDDHSPGLLSFFEGNAQLVDNGDLMVGWGQQPYFTEYDPKGNVVFDARFVDANSTYRVYRMPWTGRPNTRPAIAAHKGKGITAVYASWNGDTDVTSWRILGGSRTSSLAPLTTVAKHGFETRVVVGSEAYVAVQALDAQGHVLSQSVSATPR